MGGFKPSCSPDEGPSYSRNGLCQDLVEQKEVDHRCPLNLQVHQAVPDHDSEGAVNRGPSEQWGVFRRSKDKYLLFLLLPLLIIYVPR